MLCYTKTTLKGLIIAGFVTITVIERSLQKVSFQCGCGSQSRAPIVTFVTGLENQHRVSENFLP